MDSKYSDRAERKDNEIKELRIKLRLAKEALELCTVFIDVAHPNTACADYLMRVVKVLREDVSRGRI